MCDSDIIKMRKSGSDALFGILEGGFGALGFLNYLNYLLAATGEWHFTVC